MRRRRKEIVVACADAVADVAETLAAAGVGQAAELVVLSRDAAGLAKAGADSPKPSAGDRRMSLMAAVSGVLAITGVSVVGVVAHSDLSNDSTGQVASSADSADATAYAVQSSPPAVPVTLIPVALPSTGPAGGPGGNSANPSSTNQPTGTLGPSAAAPEPTEPVPMDVVAEPPPSQPGFFDITAYHLTPGRQYTVKADDETLFSKIAGSNGTISDHAYIAAGCKGYPATETFDIYPQGSPVSIGEVPENLGELLAGVGETLQDITCSALDLVGLGAHS